MILILLTNKELIAAADFGFTLNAGFAQSTVNLSVTNSVPMDVETLIFEKDSNGLIHVSAEKLDKQVLNCFSSTISVNSKLVILDVNYAEDFELPQIVQRTAAANRDGCMVFGMYVNSNSFAMVLSPKFDINCTSNKLFVNGVSTVDLVYQNYYVIILEKDANLTVDALNITTGQTQSQTHTAPSYTNTSGLTDNIRLQTGFQIGSWGMSANKGDADKFLQFVKMQVTGSLASTNLGTYADGTFSTGATLVKNLLTVGSETFTRKPLELSRQLQNITRIHEEQLQKSETGSRKSYEDRIEGIKLFADCIEGYNKTNLLAKTQDGRVENEVFHKLHAQRTGKISYSLIDAQTHGDYGKKLPSRQKWDVTLTLR